MLAPINNFTNINKHISFKSRWLDGQYYSDEQEEIAERIAKIRLKGWPKDLDSNNGYKYGIDDVIRVTFIACIAGVIIGLAVPPDIACASIPNQLINSFAPCTPRICPSICCLKI